MVTLYRAILISEFPTNIRVPRSFYVSFKVFFKCLGSQASGILLRCENFTSSEDGK